MKRRLLAILFIGATLLAACGKRGPPEPPGPPADITFPKVYPTQ
jgi:predicted small lipoprotein YifL